MPSLLVTALASAIPVLGVMGYLSLRHQRLDRFKDFPQPNTSVVWGHMAVLAEEMKKALKDAQFGRPRIFPLYTVTGFPFDRTRQRRAPYDIMWLLTIQTSSSATYSSRSGDLR